MSKKKVLVAALDVFTREDDAQKIREELKHQLEEGVVLLAPCVRFCCMTEVDGVHLMQDNLYPCDPMKATTCRKDSCHKNGGECYLTYRREWRKTT